MDVFQHKLYLFIAIWVIMQPIGLTAEQIPVRHIVGVTFGFLVLRNSDGGIRAYGDWKQVVKARWSRSADDGIYHSCSARVLAFRIIPTLAKIHRPAIL